MKKIYIILLALLPTMLLAQPTLTNFENWTNGMVATYNQMDTVLPHHGPAGANLTWDFSSFTADISPSVTTTATDDAHGFQYQADYPGLNKMCLATTGGLGNVYLHTLGGTSSLVGTVNNTPLIKYHYADSGLYAVNLLSYTDAYHDTCTRNFTYLTQNFCGKGTDSLTVDGWGTIKLPHGMVHQRCLRVKTVRHYRDSLCSGGPVGFSSITTYAWYDSAHAYPLLKMDSIVSPVFGTSRHYLYSTIGLGVNDISQPKVDAEIFPNPNNGNFTLSYNLLAPKADLFVRDVTGRVVYSRHISGMQGKEIINVASLAQGIYYWELTAANEISAKGKLSVMK